MDGDVAAGTPAVTAAGLVGRVLLDVHVALHAKPPAEQRLQLSVRRAVGTVALQTGVPHPAHPYRVVLEDERPAPLLVTLETRVRHRARAQHSPLLRPVRVVAVGTVDPPFEDRVVRELAQFGHLMPVAGSAHLVDRLIVRHRPRFPREAGAPVRHRDASLASNSSRGRFTTRGRVGGGAARGRRLPVRPAVPAVEEAL